MNEWLKPAVSEIASVVEKLSQKNLEVYRASSLRVAEDANHEHEIGHGAYHNRQVFELVQNAADALTEARAVGRVEIVLTDKALYCANEGAPIDSAGVEAILHSYMSRKHGAQIGHFGVGFKSVLAVTDEPKFYSRSGSFGFNRKLSEQRIREVVPDAGDVAVLRLAHPLDPNEDAKTDRELGELMQWAATVVVLPCQGRGRDILSDAIRSFPGEFLLFTEVVSVLTLIDRKVGERRLTAERFADGQIRLLEGERESRWRIFRRNAEISDEARVDLPRSWKGFEAPEVPMMWAVPLGGPREKGEFWSFFPTNEESGLRGIVNAGWKTTPDRHSIIESTLNDELVEAFAALVADSLPELFDIQDPAAHIDLLPPRDVTGVFNRELSEEVYRILRERKVVPDASGCLNVGRDLTLQPDAASVRAQELWSTVEPLPAGWVHRAVSTASRRARVRDGLGARAPATIREWIEAMFVDAPSIDNSIRALRVAEVLAEDPRNNSEVAGAAFVLTIDGGLVKPDPKNVFFSSPLDGGESVAIVHPEIGGDADARRILEKFGIHDLDESSQLGRVADAEQWARYWELVRRSPEAVARASIRILTYSGGLKVRTRIGAFVRSIDVLLPGDVVPGEDGEASAWCLDDEYHRYELPLLESEAMLSSEPRKGGGTKLEGWWRQAEDRLREDYVRLIEAQRGVRPQLGAIRLASAGVSGPLGFLTTLPPHARAIYTEKLIPLAMSDSDWCASHSSKKVNHYPDFLRESPSRELIRSHGCVLTNHGPISVSLTVGVELSKWQEFLPVARFRATDYPYLQLPGDLKALDRPRWMFALDQTHSSNSLDEVAALYVEAARSQIETPSRIRCRVGDGFAITAPEEVTATEDRSLFEAITSNGKPALLLSGGGASILIEQWGLRKAEESAPVPGFVFSGPPVLAVERFPSLRDTDVLITPCSELWTEHPTEGGLVRNACDFVVVKRTLFYLDSLSDESLLDAIRREFALEVSARPEPYAVEALRVAALGAGSIEGKLAVLLGTDGLRRRIPAQVLEAIPDASELSASELGSIAHALYGTYVFATYQAEFESCGFSTPKQWAGGEPAVNFVRSLGIPDVYAGSRSVDVQSWVDVTGPVLLPPLHHFQEAISYRLREFLRQANPDRGLLSLPTGAGKTRVTVESLVAAFTDGELRGVVLWIADRDELCEQAFQSWSEVWRAKGPPSSELRISRFWGTTNNRVIDVGDRPHVVVATYQTLIRRIKSLPWLASPSCVVIDEAHGSTTRSFTQILAEVGLSVRETKRPLIGLSATPFRSDAEETLRLVNRYGARRFDHGVFANDETVYPELQREGFLAAVEQTLIGGSELHLSDHELAQFRVLPDLPPSVERRLANDQSRNATIIAEVASRPDDWPILIFAISVTHAQVIAAELALRNISAAAITSESRIGARRNAIREFKAQRIRVLTNYGVLTTGFDAPKIRSIFITRPVFSKSLYQQMIGRGLRGPKNGGKPSCEIVNVNDNFTQYGMTLAFHHFEFLWTR